MATQTKKADFPLVQTATRTACKVATKANNLALNATEKAFTTSFTMAERCLGVSSKVVKRGLQITSTQQDMFFDVMEGIKRKIVKK